jgi:hypothetical protein|tara:strand:- start:172 stop:345 length:174 start_codon:yes stop_codon:yes gene_type:complete
MAKKTKKNIPFHITHNYKHFELTGGGIKFWAKDESDAKLYCDKVGWSPLSLEEIKEK